MWPFTYTGILAASFRRIGLLNKMKSDHLAAVLHNDC